MWQSYMEIESVINGKNKKVHVLNHNVTETKAPYIFHLSGRVEESKTNK